MIRKSRVGAVCAAVAALGVAAVPATSAQAKTTKVTWVEKGELVGSVVKGKLSGSYKGTFQSKVAVPNLEKVLTIKGGKLYVTAHADGLGATITGTWKVTKGTGKFKGAKGKGTFSGSQESGAFTYKGKVTTK